MKTDPGLSDPIEKPTRRAGLRRGLSIIRDRALPEPEGTLILNVDGLIKQFERDTLTTNEIKLANTALSWRNRAMDMNIYMVRWLLARILGWEFKFNLFLASDPGCLHDHPWPFVSIMLAGSYTEHREGGSKTYNAPCILYRPAKWRHRIEISEPCLTFNISAPRVRNWGFWTRSGWVPWAKYDGSAHECD